VVTQIKQMLNRSSSTSSLIRANKPLEIKSWHSMRDLDCTDYLSSQEDECRLAVSYDEVMMRPLSYEDELPPPQYYHRSKSHSSPSMTHQNPRAGKNLPTAILSLVKPHKILSISTEMCDFLGFGAEEMMGRSLNLLHGPKTDAKALTGAIKNTGLLSSAQFSTTLYSRDGSELRISGTCVPYFGEGGVLAGCKLQLLADENGVADPALVCVDSTIAAATADQSKRACYRSRFNFCTGLAIQLSLIRHANSRSPPQGATADV
jgi:hypothetical protein